jgi:hypothetical protein
MLKAARAHGMPMIVIAMITAATSQPTAIQTPPKIIHKMLSRRDKGDMEHCRLFGVRRTLGCLRLAVI